MNEEGISKLPSSIDLIGNSAIFLTDSRKNYDKAEKYCKKALDIDLNNAIHNGNYAGLLQIQENKELYKKYWQKAYNLATKNEIHRVITGALFL